jgi:hypothetical protein
MDERDGHGVPSLVILISRVVQANPARLLSTMSNRIRGLAPNTVSLDHIASHREVAPRQHPEEFAIAP